MSSVLNKTGVEWGNDPEEFSCTLIRLEEDDPGRPGQRRVIWRLETGYEILTAEGERIPQSDEWLPLPPQAASIAESIHTLVVARVKQKNDLP